MFFFILIAFLNLTYSLSFNNNNNFKPSYINNKPYYNDYITPKWVYNDVYNHNKKYNKISKKIKYDNISIKDEYQLIKYYKLPFGLLQPINKY